MISAATFLHPRLSLSHRPSSCFTCDGDIIRPRRRSSLPLPSSVSSGNSTLLRRRLEVIHGGKAECLQRPSDDASSEEIVPEKSRNANEIMEKLKRYGIAGVLSYGLLNTVYYLITFLIVWFKVAPAPARLGYIASVQRFIKVMLMVWAGSQVTKILRAGGALALAPFVDKGLTWFTDKFKFKSKGKAFGTIVAACLGLALLLFVTLTLLWA